MVAVSGCCHAPYLDRCLRRNHIAQSMVHCMLPHRAYSKTTRSFSIIVGVSTFLCCRRTCRARRSIARSCTRSVCNLLTLLATAACMTAIPQLTWAREARAEIACRCHWPCGVLLQVAGHTHNGRHGVALPATGVCHVSLALQVPRRHDLSTTAGLGLNRTSHTILAHLYFPTYPQQQDRVYISVTMCMMVSRPAIHAGREGGQRDKCGER